MFDVFIGKSFARKPMFEWKYTRSGPCFSFYRENHYFQSHMDFASSYKSFSLNSCGHSCSKGDLGCACPCVFYVMFNVCDANLSSLVTAKGILLWLWVRSCYLFTWYFSLFILWMMCMSDFVISFFLAGLQALGGQGTESLLLTFIYNVWDRADSQDIFFE